MLNDTTVEERLNSLEQAVSDLQRKVDTKPASEDWLQNLIGSVSDEAAFLKALEYGREFRQADHPLGEQPIDLE